MDMHNESYIDVGETDARGYDVGTSSAGLYPRRSRIGGIVTTMTGPIAPMTTE